MKDIKRIYNSPKFVTYSSAEIMEAFLPLQAHYDTTMEFNIYRQDEALLNNKPAEYRLVQVEVIGNEVVKINKVG